MNRRGFLTRVLQGTAAAVALSHIPVEWVPSTPLRRCVALEYLRKAYNEASKGLPITELPNLIVVGRDLYEAAESEFVYNFRMIRTTGTTKEQQADDLPPGLAFKGARLTYLGRGWHIVRIERTA